MAKRVLFIDDDIGRISSHVEMLEMEGNRVETMSSAKEALATFSAHADEYDVIILDVMLPRDDFTQEETNFGRETGLVLLEKLRGLDASIPIIVLTVVRDPEARRRAASFRAVTYVEKPLLPSTLCELLSQVCAPSEGGASGGEVR